jgi:hypothetical protein
VCNDTLWAHYGARRIARHRFRAYRQTQRALMELVHTIVPARDRTSTVVAYGDASFGPTGKGERAVPTTLHRKALKHHCVKVIDTDEWKTTKLCVACALPCS